MAQRIARTRGKTFGNLSSTLYFEKTKKKLKLLFKARLNLSFKDLLRLKQNTAPFPDSDVYT